MGNESSIVIASLNICMAKNSEFKKWINITEFKKWINIIEFSKIQNEIHRFFKQNSDYALFVWCTSINKNILNFFIQNRWNKSIDVNEYILYQRTI
jgi:hypothetical protein